TRFSRDWSSDGCSSDLYLPATLQALAEEIGNQHLVISLELRNVAGRDSRNGPRPRAGRTTPAGWLGSGRHIPGETGPDDCVPSARGSLAPARWWRASSCARSRWRRRG